MKKSNNNTQKMIIKTVNNLQVILSLSLSSILARVPQRALGTRTCLSIINNPMHTYIAAHNMKYLLHTESLLGRVTNASPGRIIIINREIFNYGSRAHKSHHSANLQAIYVCVCVSTWHRRTCTYMYN